MFLLYVKTFDFLVTMYLVEFDKLNYSHQLLVYINEKKKFKWCVTDEKN